MVASLRAHDRRTPAHSLPHPLRRHHWHLSAAELWSLRLDLDFEEYQAAQRNGGFKVLDHSVQDGVHNRTTLLTFEENPIPERLRGFLGAADFSFKVHSRWHERNCDEEHAMTFTSEPPVISTDISNGGTQWRHNCTCETPLPFCDKGCWHCVRNAILCGPCTFGRTSGTACIRELGPTASTPCDCQAGACGRCT